MTKEPAKPKRRRLRKACLIGAAVLVLLAALVAVLIPVVLSESRLKAMIREQGRNELGRDVTAGSVDLDLFSGVKLRDVRVANREGFGPEDFVRVKEVDVRLKAWTALFSLFKDLRATVRVVEPEVLLERNRGGELSIRDILEKERPPTEPTVLDQLVFSFDLTGGRVVFRDDLGETRRTTELRDLAIDAEQKGIDQPLVYRLTAAMEDGTLEADGRPRLFHDGVVDPEHITGELVRLTLGNLPAQNACAHLGLPPSVKSVDGSLTVEAHRPGQLAAKGKFSGSSVYEGLGFKLDFRSDVDLQKLDASAHVRAEASPFSEATLDVALQEGGAKGLAVTARFNGDLAKLTGSPAAGRLGLPLAPDGGPATSKGAFSGRLEVKGDPSKVRTLADVSIEGFQPHASLTGGTALSPEDATLKAEVIVRLGPNKQPMEIEIPLLEATSSFLQAKVRDGRLASLSDLEKLDTDLAGHVRFSGRAFSDKLGKALGLPPLHDRFHATFSAKGEGGRSQVSANATLEREAGAPEPVTFEMAGTLDGGNALADQLRIAMKAGKPDAPYAQGTVTGTATELGTAPQVDLAFSGGADLRNLAERLSAYQALFGKLKPTGQVDLTEGTLTGGMESLRAKFTLAASRLAAGGWPDSLSDVPKELRELLAEDELTCRCDVTVAPARRRVEVRTFQLDSSLVKGSVTGTVADYAALKGNLDVELKAKTDRAAPVLAALMPALEGFDTTGSVAFSGKMDTAAGTLSVQTLAATLPLVTVNLKKPGTVSGMDASKLLDDPVAAAKELSGSLALEGVLHLDRLDKLPKGLLPKELSASGDVPFRLDLTRASPATVALSADASKAAVRFTDLFAKPAGRPVTLTLRAALAESGGLDVPELAVQLEANRLNLTGALSKDFETFTCRTLTAHAEPSHLVSLVPVLKDISVAGAVDMSASGRVFLAKVAAGDLAGITFDGTLKLDAIQARYAPMPKLTVTAGGELKLSPRTADAGGLTVAVKAAPGGRNTTLTFRTLRVAAVEQDAPLLAHADALSVSFDASAPEVRLTELLAALPEPDREKATGPNAPADPGLDLAFLKGHRASGKVRVGKIVYEKYVAENVTVHVKLRDGKLTTPEPARADIHGGKVEAELAANLTASDVKHQGTVRFQRVDINQAATAALSAKDILLGQVGGKLTWTGTGLSPDDLVTRLSGDAALQVRDGVVLNFERLPLVAKVFGPVAQHLGAKAFPDNRYRYEDLDVQAHIDRGRLNVKDLAIQGLNDVDFMVPEGWVKLDGEVAGKMGVFPAEKLVMEYVGEKITKVPAAQRLIRQALQKKPPPLLSFGVAGYIRKPTVSLDATSFPKWALSAAADAIRSPRGLLDIGKDLLKKELEDEEKDEPEKDEKSEPKDILKDFLRGL
jgi:hypothetical protein